MNKISKKIVALATMAAFVLTLVPAAAFADPVTPEEYKSTVSVNSQDVALDANGNATLTIDVNVAEGETNNDFVVWIDNASGQPLSNATYSAVATSDKVANGTGNFENRGILYRLNDSNQALTAGLHQIKVDLTGVKAGDKFTLKAGMSVGGNAVDMDGLALLGEKGVVDTFSVNVASADASYVKIGKMVTVENEKYYEASVDAGDEETVSFDLRDIAGYPADAKILQNVKVWVEDASGNFSDAITFDGQTSGNHYLDVNTVTAKTELTATINRSAGSGVYYICAATFDTDGKVIDELTSAKVNVAAPTITTDYITLTGKDVTGDYTLKLDNEKKIYDINLVGYKGWDANGTAEYTLTGVAHQKDGKIVEGETVTLTSGADKNLLFGGKDASVTVKTDRNGEFKTTFTMNDKRNVPITITVGDKKFTVRIVTETSRAYDIDATVDGGYVLAGTDTDNWTNGNDSADFSDAVQFVITDEAGDVLTGDDAEMLNEPATWNATAEGSLAAEHAKYINVLGRADKSTLDAADLRLIPDGDHWTLAYVGNNATKDLTPGKYTVRVALLSGDYVEITFNAAEFGTVTDLDVKLVSHDQSTNRDLVLDDEVTLGQFVTATTQYVDENGIKIAAPRQNVRYGFDGKAVVDKDFFNGTFWTRADEISNEELLGTTIIVTAFDGGKNIDVQKTLTVVDSYNSFDLEFDPTEGPVNDEQDVAVTVVKADGEKAQVNGKLYAYIEDQSNDDAVVTVDVKKNVTNGKGELVVYASEPTEVTIRVAVEDTSNQGLYVASLDYTAGDGSIFAHHNVVMTIGSSQYVVDKQLFTMDAAPYVDSNWRTMVPIRALAEAFDATVTYDNDDRTVTIEYNEETIVMTVDDATYTVNGVEGEMDTEAVIKGDRTYVPIRFAAEAMGFTVTALYDENSSTASVVFQS
ncbi:MAG: copper amine oxidase N-terminal domain-containing protein [Peptococcaceae bacterium]|nr:copper amine oxidase N-terminal domain-containing protein [Peptococcaceae bacterium]